jgi:hypothetical protein
MAVLFLDWRAEIHWLAPVKFIEASAGRPGL